MKYKILLTAITESRKEFTIKYSPPLLTITCIYTTAFCRSFKGYFYTYSKFHSRGYSPYIYVDFNRTHIPAIGQGTQCCHSWASLSQVLLEIFLFRVFIHCRRKRKLVLETSITWKYALMNTGSNGASLIWPFICMVFRPQFGAMACFMHKLCYTS